MPSDTIRWKEGPLELENYLNLLKSRPKKEELLQIINQSDFFKCPENLHSRAHSCIIDYLLGLESKDIENKLVFDKKENPRQTYNVLSTWIGLHHQTLQTPYHDILQIGQTLLPLKPKLIVDFGAAYGRIGFVLNTILPETEFLGLEIVEERIKEGNRILKEYNKKNVQLISKDILSKNFEIPKADIYFIYQFGQINEVNALLKSLAQKFKKEEFLLIIRGDEVRDLISNSFPIFSESISPVHQPPWNIYSNKIKLGQTLN